MLMKQLIKHLQEYPPNRHVAAIIWMPDDVKEVAPDLNAKQRNQVIDAVEHGKDCTIGITWETLQLYADDIRSGGDEE